MTGQNKISQRKLIGYRIITGLLAFGMLAGGTMQLVKAKFNTDGMIHIGYPLYILPLIGAWKIAGIIIILIPGFLLLKEWAYAGFFFLLTGAVISHLASGDGIKGAAAPFIFALLTVLSWYLRPPNRRLAISVPVRTSLPAV